MKGVWHLGLVKDETIALGSWEPSLENTPELDRRLENFLWRGLVREMSGTTSGSGCFGLTRVGGRGLIQIIFEKKGRTFFLKIVSSQPNIENMFFDQRSPQPPEEGVSNCH